jgi:hypothetical protein
LAQVLRLKILRILQQQLTPYGAKLLNNLDINI